MLSDLRISVTTGVEAGFGVFVGVPVAEEIIAVNVGATAVGVLVVEVAGRHPANTTKNKPTNNLARIHRDVFTDTSQLIIDRRSQSKQYYITMEFYLITLLMFQNLKDKIQSIK